MDNENKFPVPSFSNWHNSAIETLRHNAILAVGITCLLMLFCTSSSFSQEKTQMVRLAKLRIAPTQLENYKAALKEEIETSVRLEPGVITLYAVSEKDNPSHITI